MNDKILVTYASVKGSTTGVARTIGDVLRQERVDVDVLPIGQVIGPSPYRAVILGSAVYGGHWLEEAVEFLETYRSALSRMPVAYFIVCLTLREDTHEHRRKVQDYIAPVLKATPEVRPVDIGAFSGAFDTRQWPLAILLSLKAMGELPPEGDFRDWEKIATWARSTHAKLQRKSMAAAV